MSYVIGIDVGTNSVRGALVSRSGKIINTCSSDITIWNPKPDFYHQSSEQIWSISCDVVKNLVKNISPSEVKGLAFAATCSMAIFDPCGNPVSANKDVDDEQNVILWLDHRAREEAHIINETKHDVLRYVGGSISLEMMIPKILWLKNNHPECWSRAGYFFVLSDFLTWRATSTEHRSLCSVSYFRTSNTTMDTGWNEDFFQKIGLAELSENNWRKIGSTILKPGDLCGTLTDEAAKELGLVSGLPVAVSMVDAYAGGLGVIGCAAKNVSSDFTSRLALICGTSTCHMAQSTKKTYIPGIWGPYFGPMIPGLWFLGGGQTATGKLIDHIIDTHPAAHSIRRNCGGTLRITQYLNNLLYEIAEKHNLTSVDELTKDVHIWPDFHGNRTPLADPTMRGMVNGLTLAHSEEDLAILYLATIQALAYGTKHIIDVMEQHGHTIKSIILCGGLSKNEIFVRTHSNALKAYEILIPEEVESTLLGSAMLGASVAGFYSDIKEAVLKMAGPAKHLKSDANVVRYHRRKYKVFLEMINHQKLCKSIMSGKYD